MKKLKSIKSLRKQADELYQEKGMRDNPRCLICGMPAHCLHHFYSKSVASSLRYELLNGIKICAGCHLRLHSSGDPEYEETIKRKMGGEQWLNQLRELRKKPVKTNRKYYQDVIKKLSTLL